MSITLRGEGRRASLVGKLSAIVLGSTVSFMQGCEGIAAGLLVGDSINQAAKKEAYERELDRQNRLEVARILANGKNGSGVSPGALYDLVENMPRARNEPVDPIVSKFGQIEETYEATWITSDGWDGTARAGTLRVHERAFYFEGVNKGDHFTVPDNLIEAVEYVPERKGLFDFKRELVHFKVRGEGKLKFFLLFPGGNTKEITGRLQEYAETPSQ